MRVQEIKQEIENFPAEDRRQLVAFLVALSHNDFANYRSAIARKIDDARPQNWVTLDEYDQRLGC